MARKRKVGRPKNKILTGLQQALEHAKGDDRHYTDADKVREIMKTADNAWHNKIISTDEPIFTRLETAIVKFETAIDEAIAKLNRMV